MEWYESEQLIDSLLNEVIDELESEADVFAKRASHPRPLRKTAQVGSYAKVRGHHIHQSASYGTGGESRRTNPYHRQAIAIGHSPEFTRQQHRQADSVQRRINRSLHGLKIGDEKNPVRVKARGGGRLPPTPTPWVEDVKAYYSLRAARPKGYSQPHKALDLVERSARDLERSGVYPRRVPTR